jgi:deazaflavin-dependent oxidoreductase (nitroreductase family)
MDKDGRQLIEQLSVPEPPHGLLRRLARLPIYLYRMHLGRLLGTRFLRLKHIGRVSSLPRFTVLEVLDYDRDKDTYFVASGWGERSDWVKNIAADPQVEIQVAGRHIPARARRAAPDEAAQEMLQYGRAHPTALQELARVMGYRVERSEAAYLALGREVPVFAFEPDPDRKDVR